MAHSTVAVNETNSSEVWAAFRVGARAKVKNVKTNLDGETLSASAQHNGYLKAYGLDHTRKWTLTSHQLTVTDEVSKSAKSALARFYLHPDITPLQNQQLKLPNGRVISWEVTGGTAVVEPTLWFPEFGKSIDNHCIIVRMTNNNTRSIFNIFF